MPHRLSRAWIDRVRPPLPITLAYVPAAAGGRDGHVGERDAHRLGTRLDEHLPGLSEWAPPYATHFAADLHEEVAKAESLQGTSHPIYRIALGDAGQIEPNVA